MHLDVLRDLWYLLGYLILVELLFVIDIVLTHVVLLHLVRVEFARIISVSIRAYEGLLRRGGARTDLNVLCLLRNLIHYILVIIFILELYLGLFGLDVLHLHLLATFFDIWVRAARIVSRLLLLVLHLTIKIRHF